MQDGERSAGQQQAQPEQGEALDLTTRHVPTTRDAEGQPPVGAGVRDRRDEQRGQIRTLSPDGTAKEHEQQDVAESAGDPDGGEPQHLPTQPSRYPGYRGDERPTPELATQLGYRQRSGTECTQHPSDATEV